MTASSRLRRSLLAAALCCATSVPAAQANTDLRSPDARDAARPARTDLRSPDARDAARPIAGPARTDMRSPDARDAASPVSTYAVSADTGNARRLAPVQSNAAGTSGSSEALWLIVCICAALGSAAIVGRSARRRRAAV